MFDSLFVNLVAAGEIGGILDTILNRLATYIERSVKLRRQVKSAMMYPIGILVVAVLVIIALLKWVIPTFANMFSDFGDAEMPKLTQMVIDASEWFGANFYWVILAMGGTIFLFQKLIATDRGEYIFHSVLLKLPLMGALLRKVAVAKFTRTLGTMIASVYPFSTPWILLRKQQ